MRICSGAGCLRAVDDRTRYCDECKPPVLPAPDERTHTSGYDAQLDRLRKGPRWQRLSHRVIREQPMCAWCDRAVSVETDHIVPAREAIAQAQGSGLYSDRFAGYYLRSNLQGLCRACHIQKTIGDKTHVGPWPNVVEREQTAPKRRYEF